jgi:hypothetical protein
MNLGDMFGIAGGLQKFRVRTPTSPHKCAQTVMRLRRLTHLFDRSADLFTSSARWYTRSVLVYKPGRYQ